MLRKLSVSNNQNGNGLVDTEIQQNKRSELVNVIAAKLNFQRNN
jgi:hypothetical protein